MAFESQEMGKRTGAGKILQWGDLPIGEFKVRKVREAINLNKWIRMILTLERNGETIKVWACNEMMYDMERIPRRKWRDIIVVNYGEKMQINGRLWHFEFEVMT